MADKFGFDEVKEYRLIPELLFFQEGPGVRNTQYTDSGVKLLNVANLVDGKIDLSTSDRYISEEEAYGKYAHFLVEDGDFIIASSGIKVEYFEKKMGFVSANQLPLCMNTSTIRFRTLDENVLNIRYFMYYLKSKSFKLQLEKQITGSAQLNFGPSHLKKMYVPVVGLESQKAICRKLDKINRVLELKRNQIEELDTLIKARFVEMFGVPGLDAKYETIRLKECCIVNPKKNNDLRLQDGLEVSFVPMPAVSEHGDIDTSEIRLFEDVKTGFTYFAEGDVLFAKITPCMENGKGAVARNLKNGIGFGSTEFHVLRPDYEMANSVWLYTLTTFKQFRVDAESKMTGSAGQRRVSASFLKNYKVSLPPIELQNQFADFVTQVDKLKVVVQYQKEFKCNRHLNIE